MELGRVAFFFFIGSVTREDQTVHTLVGLLELGLGGKVLGSHYEG